MTKRTVLITQKGSSLGTGKFSIREKGDLIVKVTVFIRKISFHLKSKERERKTNKQTEITAYDGEGPSFYNYVLSLNSCHVVQLRSIYK